MIEQLQASPTDNIKLDYCLQQKTYSVNMLKKIKNCDIFAIVNIIMGRIVLLSLFAFAPERSKYCLILH